jgi:hypothetical protein
MNSTAISYVLYASVRSWRLGAVQVPCELACVLEWIDVCYVRGAVKCVLYVLGAGAGAERRGRSLWIQPEG